MTALVNIRCREGGVSLARDLLVAIAAPLATQLGEGVREWLRARRERDAPCEHGRPGGRLCARCSEETS